jgi:hypothetical protein
MESGYIKTMVSVRDVEKEAWIGTSAAEAAPCDIVGSYDS